MIYRSQIRPHYHDHIRVGFDRYRSKRATQAALQLAQEALDFTYTPPQDSVQCRKWVTLARAMGDLRDGGVTAEALLCRVAEFVAYLEDHPSTFKSRRAEEFALARCVLHMIRWQGEGRGQGAELMEVVGPLIREACYPFALALVKKLTQDIDHQHELKKASANLDD